MSDQLKRLSILVFAAFLHSYGFANETVRISKMLQWTDLAKSRIADQEPLDFAESFRDADFNGLPFVVHRQKLENFSAVTDIQWIQNQSSVVNAGLLSAHERKAITNDFQVEARVTDGAGVPYLVVTIFPFRSDDRASIERLTSFEIEINLVTAPRTGSRSLNFADNSVLSEGTWYKISTGRDGIYKIDKNLLTQLGIDITTLDPQQLNIYGNGGQLLPDDNSIARPDDLLPCSIFLQNNGDASVFNDNDYVLFYAKGPDTWRSQFETTTDRDRWTHTKHFYSDSAYYFIRIDDAAPKRVLPLTLPDVPATHTVNKFQDYQYLENDLFNLAKSGREFYGEEFDLNLNQNFSFSMPNLKADEPALMEARVAVRSIGGNSNFTFTVNGSSVSSNPTTTSDGTISSVAAVDEVELSFTPSGSTANVAVTFNKYSSVGDVKGWLDYIRINATRTLTMAGNQMKFRDTTEVGAGSIGLFQLAGASTLSQVWDITDYTNPLSVGYTAGSIAEWKLSTDVVHEFIAFTSSGYLTPSAVGPVGNQNLHALNDIDLVIVTAPGFINQARSVADIHAAEGLTVAVMTPLDIFNEFSSGNADVTAIRMMMKMLYDRAEGNVELMPKNLLLFGDGDYSHNKGVAAFTGNNMMVFEADNSLSPTQSYVSDDYFVFLSDDDDVSPSNLLDAGVGRIPSTDPSEATGYVDKIHAYKAQNTVTTGAAACIGDAVQSPYGAWRNILVFVSDDQDGSGGPIEQVHLRDSDTLSSIIQQYHPEYDVVKIYMDAYKQESTPGGKRYPDGEVAIKNRVENGALIVTYLGHGGERGWAHERILDINTISSWTNKYRLPVFLTATCELARYDDPEFNTAGEILVMNPNGGAIAMLTTTRIVFAGSNMEMDRSFYDVALEDETIPDLTLGKINMMTKNGVTTSNSSKPNFSLLGDPALKMSYPKYEVFTTHINGQPLESFGDTLKALQEVEFRGYVGDGDGNKLTGFNGFIYPTVFDKMTHVYTQNNDATPDAGIVQDYYVFNKNIFKGKASVNAGDFSFKFVVPFDINYTVGNGRVSYYSVAGNDDGHGYSQDFLIGSSLSGAELNTIGPEIDIFLNDTTFVSGGISDTKPILLAQLRDENGINTVGNGIGHDLIAVLDSDSQNPIVLNEYYETDLDTYKSGEVRYQLSDLAVGNHKLSLKAWDVHNNSSTASLDFTVAENSAIALQHVLNYPNPFTTHTEFMFEHNQACTMLQVRVQVFTVSGKLVKTLEQEVHQNGFRSDPIAWDGTDDFGDRIGKGVYVYRIEVKNDDGQRAEQYEKLVILK